MEDRQSVLHTEETNVSFAQAHEEHMQSYVIAPIIAGGDPIGAVIIFSKDKTLGEVEHKAAETAASFLARQMEQ